MIRKMIDKIKNFFWPQVDFSEKDNIEENIFEELIGCQPSNMTTSIETEKQPWFEDKMTKYGGVKK